MDIENYDYELIKLAARKLCQLRGINPDAPCADYPAITEWQGLYDQVGERLNMDAAVHYARRVRAWQEEKNAELAPRTDLP